MKYAVVRILFKGEEESHSVQFYDTESEAKKRFFAIMDSDINNKSTTYNAVYIFDKDGNIVKKEINDIRTVKSQFYVVVRYFFKGNTASTSVQYYPFDYDTVRSVYKTALQRWFNIIAADLLDKDIVENGSYMFRNNGELEETRTFYDDDEE